MTFDWDQIAATVNSLVAVGAPIAEALAPEAAPAIEIGATILKGIAAAEPAAKALAAQIQSGTPITADQLAQYYSTYQKDDDALAADIAAHLAAPK